MVQGVSDLVLTEQMASKNSHTKKTTITPFKKVLEGTTSSSSAADRVNQASENGTTSMEGGQTTLKAIFEEAALKYDVPYDFLVAVAKTESNFRTEATSGKGAQGIMQLMPATAKELGVTDAYDVKQNIMAGAKYLGAHLKAFKGDKDLAAAAYNAGGGAVRKYGGIPPYSETQNYVKTIHRYMKQGVTVPDRTVTVAGEKSSKDTTSNDITNAVAATDSEMQSSTIIVGSGDNAITMTYGAYLRYLELGTGVG